MSYLKLKGEKETVWNKGAKEPYGSNGDNPLVPIFYFIMFLTVVPVAAVCRFVAKIFGGIRVIVRKMT